MTLPKVLLTAFEPFGGDTINPSLEIALGLTGSVIGGHRIVGQVLPVAFGETAHTLRHTLQVERPALVIALGQAGGRSEISLERVAINLIDARIADNAGVQPIDRPVVAGAPSAYFSTLPVKAMRNALHAEGIPAQISFSAGSFVCNQVFYLLMHELATMRSSARAGFVHVPYLPAQAAFHPGAPSMSLETMIAGLRFGIAAAIETAVDIEVAAGETH
jgi:pyroglutamyl-peptidase